MNKVLFHVDVNLYKDCTTMTDLFHVDGYLLELSSIIFVKQLVIIRKLLIYLKSVYFLLKFKIVILRQIRQI